MNSLAFLPNSSIIYAGIGAILIGWFFFFIILLHKRKERKSGILVHLLSLFAVLGLFLTAFGVLFLVSHHSSKIDSALNTYLNMSYLTFFLVIVSGLMGFASITKLKKSFLMRSILYIYYFVTSSMIGITGYIYYTAIL